MRVTNSVLKRRIELEIYRKVEDKGFVKKPLIMIIFEGNLKIIGIWLLVVVGEGSLVLVVILSNWCSFIHNVLWLVHKVLGHVRSAHGDSAGVSVLIGIRSLLVSKSIPDNGGVTGCCWDSEGIEQ